MHHDMRSHTGGMMTLGKGAMCSTSTRQKINGKSSTEAELIGVDDVMGIVVWTRNFLQAQGHDVKDNVVHQDNKSATSLEKNGKASSSKRTRHINMRYYFITDCIKVNELQVKYYLIDDIVAIYLTKPLQRAKFKNFRKAIEITNRSKKRQF